MRCYAMRCDVQSDAITGDKDIKSHSVLFVCRVLLCLRRVKSKRGGIVVVVSRNKCCVVVAREQCSSKYHEKATTVRLGGIRGGNGRRGWGMDRRGPVKKMMSMAHWQLSLAGCYMVYAVQVGLACSDVLALQGSSGRFSAVPGSRAHGTVRYRRGYGMGNGAVHGSRCQKVCTWVPWRCPSTRLTVPTGDGPGTAQ